MTDKIEVTQAVVKRIAELSRSSGMLMDSDREALAVAAVALHSLAHSAQPAPASEPVAWAYRFIHANGTLEEPVYFPIRKDWAENHPRWTETPLYAAPPASVDRNAVLEALEAARVYIAIDYGCGVVRGTETAKDLLDKIDAALRTEPAAQEGE